MTEGCAAAYASLGGHSVSGFVHLLLYEQNLVTDSGARPVADTSAPFDEDVTDHQWLVAYETDITQWSFAGMNLACWTSQYVHCADLSV